MPQWLAGLPSAGSCAQRALPMAAQPSLASAGASAPSGPLREVGAERQRLGCGDGTYLIWEGWEPASEIWRLRTQGAGTQV